MKGEYASRHEPRRFSGSRPNRCFHGASYAEPCKPCERVQEIATAQRRHRGGTAYLAALRDGPGLVYLDTDGRWLPMSAFRVRGSTLRLRRFGNPAAAMEVADLLAKRLGCGWRVETTP